MVAPLGCSARDAQSYDRVGKIVIDRKKFVRIRDRAKSRLRLCAVSFVPCAMGPLHGTVLSVHKAAPVDLASAPTKSPKCLTNSTLTAAV